jgi:hypothetical protein
MPIISLGSFLKIITKGTPQKVQLYGRYLTPGGFGGYYRPLQDGVHELTVGAEKYSEVLSTIKELPWESQREHNVQAIKNFDKWTKKYKPSGFFAAPVGTVSTPGKYLSIKLEPEFGAVLSGEKRLLQVWYSKDTTLSKTAIGIGERLIEKHLCVGSYSDCKAGILDLWRKAVLVHEPDDIAMDLMIAGEFAWIDGFFQAQKESKKPAVA